MTFVVPTHSQLTELNCIGGTQDEGGEPKKEGAEPEKEGAPIPPSAPAPVPEAETDDKQSDEILETFKRRKIEAGDGEAVTSVRESMIARIKGELAGGAHFESLSQQQALASLDVLTRVQSDLMSLPCVRNFMSSE